MKRTAIYLRVSSEYQAREGESLEYQRRTLMHHIKKHPDLVFVGEYMDDGISGTKFSQRDELQRMLHDVEEGKIDLIIFTKLDRFFRSVRHLMNTLDYLDRKGVEWNAIEENHNNSTPTGKLALTIMGAFSEMEANMGSVRVKDAFKNKMVKKEWLNNKPPFGYKIENKRAVLDPDKAEIARNIFSDYSKHGCMSRVISDYSKDGAPVSYRGMRHLLSNRAYLGEAHGQADYLDALIDQNTFDNVQRLLQMNVKSSTKRSYIFSGLLVCPVCGGAMSCTSVKKKYPQYRCARHKNHRCEYKRSFSESKLESFLINRYKEDLEKRYLTLKSRKQTDNSQKINALYRKIDRLKDLYVNELIDMETYKADLNRYKDEIAKLNVPQETNARNIEKLLKMNVYEIYWTLTSEQKKRLWRGVIKSITPTEDSFFVEYL